jgi:putative spermidine/putrescine transport system permease protein
MTTKAINTSPFRAVATLTYSRPALVLALLLLAPMLWLGVIYLGSLFALFAQSFFHVDEFSGVIVYEVGLSTYAELLTQANLDIIMRSLVMATVVTIAAAIVSVPLAVYIAFHAGPRLKAVLFAAVLLPLWSSYLVRVYAWKLILAKEGIVSWFAGMTGTQGLIDWALNLPVVGGPSLSTSYIGTFVVFLYIWLPYAILPVHAALERVPRTLLDAAADLGAKPGETFRHVILPLIVPGIAAGSIFTFALTLGDYIIPGIIGPTPLFIGQAVLAHQGAAGNLPLAAAFSVAPLVILAVYLYIARRLGAFDAL